MFMFAFTLPLAYNFVYKFVLHFVYTATVVTDFFSMLSLAGPTPIHSIGVFKKFSMNSTYFLQLSGRSAYDVVSQIEVFHPGSVTYTTETFSRIPRSAVRRHETKILGNQITLDFVSIVDINRKILTREPR